ncbi:Hypothetical predicted protein [Marmota monax]|uniref:Uncharacterized protein n=1 Tax=Marmota monax TaxID=9995 RepID=A0A5E4CYX7_MARMO|nr:Hypothetical predicted protein [Marmota monax]
MNDAHMDSGVRYTPYVIPSHHWRSNLYKQDQTHGNMERAQKPPERRTEENRQNGTLGSWFKITIPFGIKYEEKWLLNLIQSQCSLPFTPVEFHYEKMQAQFFVENASIAFALKNIGDKIRDEDNEKLTLPTYQLVGMMNTMPKDLSIENPNVSKSKVKSAGKMDSGKGLEPEEMCADRNSLCTTFLDKSNNMKRRQPWFSGRTTGSTLSYVCVPQLCSQVCFASSDLLPFSPGLVYVFHLSAPGRLQNALLG